MKAGDKVILKKYESTDSFFWREDCVFHLEKEVTVIKIDEDDSSFEFLYEGAADWWLQSACEPVKNERYFLFSYVSNWNTGNTWMKSEDGKIPSHKSLINTIKGNLGTKNATITNIFEFKSEQDFLDFTSNE